MIKKTFNDFKLMLESGFPSVTSGVSLSAVLDDATIDNNPELWESNKKFLSKFHLTLEELPVDSWSRISKKGSGELSSEEAWYEINLSLKMVGLRWDDVVKNKDVIFENIDTYSYLNAHTDIILYNLDNNYEVSGWPGDIVDNIEEIVIKYRYGYHHTTYGRIFIKRYWGSVESFIEKYAKNILYCLIEDTKCVPSSIQKEVLPEIREYDGLTKWDSPILTVYFGGFYDIVRPYLDSADTHDLNYEKFKSFFINWVYSLNSDYEIEDYDDHMEIDFSADI